MKAVLFYFCILVSLLRNDCFAQPTILWQKSYGGTDDDFGDALIRCSDGNYVIAGAHNSTDGDIASPISLAGSSDFWLIKIDSIGSILWEKSFGGIASEDAFVICETYDLGFAIGGKSQINDGQVTGSFWAGDYWIVRTDSMGDFLWAKCFGSNGRDVITEIHQTRDSGLIICGYIDGDGGNVISWFGSYDYWIIKLDKNGYLQWQRTIGGYSIDECNSIKEMHNGNFIVSGSVSAASGFPGNHGSDDFGVFILDSVGNILWQKCYGGSNSEYGARVLLDSNNGFYLAGSTTSNNGDVSGNHGIPDFWILHCDSAGNIIWSKCYGSVNMEELADIKLTSDGGMIAVGETQIGLESNFAIVKIDSNQNVEWNLSLGGSKNEMARSVLEVSPGKYLVTGNTNSYDGDVSFNHDTTTYDIWTVMISDISVGTSYIKTESVYDIAVFQRDNTLNTRFFSHINEEVQMEIYNVAGQRVAELTVRISEGINYFTLPGEYKTGSYCLRISGMNYTQSKVFVVAE